MLIWPIFTLEKKKNISKLKRKLIYDYLKGKYWHYSITFSCQPVKCTCIFSCQPVKWINFRRKVLLLANHTLISSCPYRISYNEFLLFGSADKACPGSTRCKKNPTPWSGDSRSHRNPRRYTGRWRNSPPCRPPADNPTTPGSRSR